MSIDELIEAAEGGDSETIEGAIAEGFPLDTRDRFGRTALVTAAANGHPELVRRLLDVGARDDVHEPDVMYYYGSTARSELRGRWTLLHAAAQGGSEETIAWLIDVRGMDPNARDHGGWTPLHVASFYALSSLSTLDALLSRGADPDAEDALGRNTLCAARNVHFLRHLLDAGAHPDGGDHVAPVEERVPSIIDGKHLGYVRAENPERPIERFAAGGDAEVVELLLARGAKVTERALQGAAMAGSSALVVRLARELPPEARARALDAAADDATFAALLGEMESVSGEALLAAARAGSIERVRAALARGAVVDARDDAGRSALHIAAAQGSLALVQLLVEGGADPNARDDASRTALHLAAARGELELVRLLVERGADANARDADGKTPRALAFQQSSSEHDAVKRFLEPLTAATPPKPAPPIGPTPGQRVHHAKFGPGTLVRVDGDKATVRFDEAGEKTLLTRVLSFDACRQA